MMILSTLVNMGNDFDGGFIFKVREEATTLDLTLNGLGYVAVGTQSNGFNGYFEW